MILKIICNLVKRSTEHLLSQVIICSNNQLHINLFIRIFMRHYKLNVNSFIDTMI